MRSAIREVVYLYNCGRCKRGRRVVYHRDGSKFRPQIERVDADGKRIPAGVWVERAGGGHPTVYGGDPLGVCDGCGKAMEYGQLQAFSAPDVKCDARCTGARGFQCSCSCNGKNHGAGWSA